MFDLVRHRTPQRCLVGDELHALNLGVLNRLSKEMLWSVLAPRTPGAPPCSAIAIQVNTLSVRHAYYQWHRRRHAANPLERLTRIGDFGSKVFGTTPDSSLKTKGAECWSLLLFLVDHLADRVMPSTVAQLLNGARALVRMITIWKTSGPSLPTSAVQESYDCWNDFVHATQWCDELNIPKKHMVLHMLERLTEAGNPTYYSNWLNESLNKLLKQCCRNVSQHTFESGLLIRMRALLRKRGASTKRYMR